MSVPFQRAGRPADGGWGTLQRVPVTDDLVDELVEDAENGSPRASHGSVGRADRPEIVCICGSTRFVDEMRAANRDLTFAGVLVVAPGVFSHEEDDAGDGSITDEQKRALDALHLRKIDLADRVLVVNPGGYIGESTSREIAYARATGTPVSFTHPS
ncbi:MAG: hypothetical protein ACRCZD_10970 [Phycicoccus sp.]